MKIFTLALLGTCLALNTNTRAQNAADNSKQQPTIEDRLGQLEQKQEDLAGRVDALDQKIADLQRDVKALGQQGGSAGSERSVGPANAPNDNSAGEQSTSQAVSYDVFYDRLQSDGRWFNDETYGLVWQPNSASADQNWRPYTDGRWVYTDRGWTWLSNENFGWATYHYGRWARLSDTGWVWVPGSKWAPAWVSWRQSDDYVGWAPLPPEAESDQNPKIEGWADNYYNIGPASYVFLKTTDLGNRSYRGLIASPRDPVDFISRTRNVTHIYYGNGGIIDNGPNYEQLVQRSNVKIDRYRLNYVQQNDPQAQFAETARGDQLQVVAPAAQVQRAATVQPKVAGNVSKAQIDRGWQGIDEAKAQQLKQTWQRETPVPASLPSKPETPRPMFARASGQQGQPAGQQSATENREQNPPPATQNEQPANQPTTATPSPSPARNAPQPVQEQPGVNQQRQESRQAERPETTPPAPSPSPARDEKAAQPEQQQPGVNQQRRESRQVERPETTPPAPSPSPVEKAQQNGSQPPAANEERPKERKQGAHRETSSPTPALHKDRSEQGQPSASENRRRESGEAERSDPRHAASTTSKSDQPGQPEVKPGGENGEEQTPDSAAGSSEKAGAPEKEKTTRNLKNSEEAPTKEEGARSEGSENSRKSNVTGRPAPRESKGPSRDQSESEKPAAKKRPEEVEKKTPSQQPQ